MFGARGVGQGGGAAGGDDPPLGLGELGEPPPHPLGQLVQGPPALLQLMAAPVDSNCDPSSTSGGNSGSPLSME